jgi:DNA-binding transcriptional regulator YbjK
VPTHYLYSYGMAGNRERALAAAVELVGTEGLRSLTHVRVDQRAGLPKGSTSNHFRTRAALLEGVLAWMIESEVPEVDGAARAPATVEELVESLAAVYDFMMGPNRTVTTARMVLLLEAGHDPALREALRRGRATMAATLLPTLARLGAPDPQLAVDTLAACFEGLFLHDIGRHATPDARAVLALVARAAVGD